MSLPEVLQRDRWTEDTARAALPLLIWCAQNGRTITYGRLDKEIVDRGWGHHVMAVQYGRPAGTIGDALIETEDEWGELIPPLNALVVNATNGLPSKGVNYYLERYCAPDTHVDDMSLTEKRAIVEEVWEEIWGFERWDKLLEEYGLDPVTRGLVDDEEENEVFVPKKGGWSTEPESEEHKLLKLYVAAYPEVVGLDRKSPKGTIEYLFPSADKADVVFVNGDRLTGVEVKSRISNEADISRGIFQCVKYQALLRAEQKAAYVPPTARAVLVTENALTSAQRELADQLGIKVVVFRIKAMI